MDGDARLVGYRTPHKFLGKNLLGESRFVWGSS